MKEADEFYGILKDPVSYGRKMKEQGRKIVGYFCSYTPEEIIYAAGAHPFRIFAGGENIHFADAHLQSYCCSLAILISSMGQFSRTRVIRSSGSPISGV